MAPRFNQPSVSPRFVSRLLVLNSVLQDPQPEAFVSDESTKVQMREMGDLREVSISEMSGFP